MPTVTETEDRLRDTLTAVASSVRDTDEATPDFVGAAQPIATPPPPGRAGATRRRPLLVFAASFLGVLLVGAVSMVTGGTGTDSDAAGVSSQSEEATAEPMSGLGMDGSHFAIDDQSWTLAEAWETSEGGPGTFLIYQRGNEHAMVQTGSATAHLPEPEREGSETTLTINSNQVTERSFAGDVIFDWTTSEGTSVAVTFSGMDRNRALKVATALRPIDSEAWEELLETARSKVQARTGESGTGGEEGTGEWIRLDAPDAPEVILELAEGIELPPGHTFDRLIENLREEPNQQTEQGIRVMLEFEAGCIWTGYWLDAVEAGDTEAQREALAVLEDIPAWPTLNATDGGGTVEAWTRNAELAAAGDVQGVLDNLYTNNCTDVVPGQ